MEASRTFTTRLGDLAACSGVPCTGTAPDASEPDPSICVQSLAVIPPAMAGSDGSLCGARQRLGAGSAPR
jgi:hypothetical protein